jgi:4-amino-4-deoxy-L-arabinose transferase-like glycosyltransferase
MRWKIERTGYALAFAAVALVYLHNTLPHLTMLPRVNVDEPWLMERAYQVMKTGVPSQPMLGLKTAYFLQVGYAYLFAPWMTLAGVGLLQARLLTVLLGLGAIWCVAVIGRHSIDRVTGIAAALFLAVDSNFLGGARSARTDMPSVFFAAAALAAYVIARKRSRGGWFALSGACLGAAVLVHGNAFWVGVILLAWYVLDYGIVAGITRSFGYWFIGGVLLTFGPYLATVVSRWHDVQVQIGNFAADRVPTWRPGTIWREIILEASRYHDWYFGLVTSPVPNPLLSLFRVAIVLGIIVLAIRALAGPRRTDAEVHGPRRLLILSVGTAFIFAAFINNKVPVYMPHVLLGFSLAAGVFVSEAAALLPGWRPFALALVAAYGLAGVFYYEKWYSTAAKSELVPYESTVATLRALTPAGAKYLFASPQFWTPFHDEPGTTFLSFAAAQPRESGGTAVVAGTAEDRPIVLLVDEVQWLPEIVAGVSGPSDAWRRDWANFIETRCVLDGFALGTAHGTIAAYVCGLSQRPPSRVARIIGGSTDYTVGGAALLQSAAQLASWTRYDDPRRSPSARPSVALTSEGLRISGNGWPGVVKMFDATPGERYLVRTDDSMTRDGDLLYLGMWQQPQVLSMSGASSSGIPAPLISPRWFPRDRAFVATAPKVRVLVYSEAPSTDFLISSLDIFRLVPSTSARAAETR